MDNKKIFFIITTNKYPTGDAGAVRLHAFAKIFASLGYNPVVIGLGDSTDFKEENFEEIRYISLRYPCNDFFRRVLGRIRFYKNMKRYVCSFPKYQVSGVLIDSGSAKVFEFVSDYTEKNNIPLIYDAVEWYSPCEFKHGAKSITYKYNEALNTRIVNEKYKVFSISCFLERHFINRGITTLRVPVIMDVEKISCHMNYECSGIFKIIYAGTITGKDHISELIDAICRLNKEDAEKIQFCVVGITREQYEKKFGYINNEVVEKSIKFFGRISRDEVLEHLKSADFSFLLRPSDERYAKAGFPTKVVESLASGTPVLCNYSSDLSFYLEDGINSLIIDDCSIESCYKALKKVLSLDKHDVLKMKQEARKTAEKNFDWRLYVNEIDKFIKQ